MGTSFNVNITSIALDIAIQRGIAIEIVDPTPVKIHYNKVVYHEMSSNEYCLSRIHG